MSKLTDKSALITPANDDLLYIVDVSDTTDSAQGTSKKIEFQNIATSISYASLLSKPSLGSLAPLDYLSFGSLVSKPSLGSLAPLNTITAPYLNYAGQNNQILSVNSSVSTGLSWITQPISFRNLLINGDFGIAQRSASVPSLASLNSYFTADRWQLNNIGPTILQSIENDGPSGTYLKKSIKNTYTTAKLSLASGDYSLIRQSIEGQNVQQLLKGTANAKSLTLSFWVKSNVTGTYIAELVDNDNTRNFPKSYSIDTTNTWEYKTLTYAGDTTGALDNDTLASLSVNFIQSAGATFTGGSLPSTWGATSNSGRYAGQVNACASTNNYFQLTGVQLEIANEASEFEYIPNDVNYQRCLRYCYVLGGYGNLAITTRGIMYANNAGRVWVDFPVKMRGTPTATISSNDYEILGVGPTTGTFANPFYSIEAATWDGTNTPTTGALGRAFSYTGAGNFSAEI